MALPLYVPCEAFVTEANVVGRALFFAGGFAEPINQIAQGNLSAEFRS
jgi:hypothetical protein